MSTSIEANCLFCKIIDGQIPSQKLSEDDHSIAIADVNPQAPVHLLIMPKKHVASITALESSELTAHLFQKAKQLAAEMKLEKGFRIVVNTGNDGGQTVHHLHIHLLGGRAFGWPPG
jgi:histidine triad (HIT) family protein